MPAMLVGIATRKRRKLLSYCLLFLIAGCLVQVGCGGGGGSTSTGTGGTPAGSYTITVTAAAGSTQQALPLTVIVQ